MESMEDRAREIQRSIAAILLRDWDPLGPDNRPQDSSDEYDAYVGPIYRLIASGASERAIAEHLARVEADAFGFPNTEPDALLPVARKLRALDVRLTSSRTAT
jgi:hypothetical protein